MDLHRLIDLALATPTIGVVNWSLLKTLLHIIVQQTKLDTYKIELEENFAKEVESIRLNVSVTKPTITSDGNFIGKSKRPVYSFIKSDPQSTESGIKQEPSSSSSLRRQSTETAPITTEIEYVVRSSSASTLERHSTVKRQRTELIADERKYAAENKYISDMEFIDEFECANDNAIDVTNSEESFIESTDKLTARLVKCELIQSITAKKTIQRDPTTLKIVKNIIDNVISTVTGDQEQQIPRPSCVDRVMDEILVNVYNAQQSQLESKPVPVDVAADRFIRWSEFNELFERAMGNRLPRNDVYDHIQKLLDDSKLIDNESIVYDIREYFELNVQHLCDKLEGYIKCKIERDNDSIIIDSKMKADGVEDAQIQTDAMPQKRWKQHMSESTLNQPNVRKSMKGKRFCGGRHTLTKPESRVMRKGNFKEQYIDLMAQQMKDQLERKKKQPTDVFKNNNNNNLYGVNVCNCYMDPSRGFIICGTGSRSKYE